MRVLHSVKYKNRLAAAMNISWQYGLKISEKYKVNSKKHQKNIRKT